MHSGLSEQAALRNRLSGYSGDDISSTSNRCWANCTNCGLHRTRNRVALKRRGGHGRVRLLFIGEAPGEFEDVMGVPFIGPAGNILNKTIDYCFLSFHAQFSYVITNTVNCRPQTVLFLSTEAEEWDFNTLVPGEDYEVYDHNRDPTPQEIEACRPHIDEIASDFRPHGIIYLGRVATSYKSPLPSLELLHPVYIARLECKLQTVLTQAEKLSRFVHRLGHEIPYE